MCFSLSTPIPLIVITATFSVTPCKLQLDTNNLTKKNHTTKQSYLNRHPQFSFYFDGVKLSLISSPFIWKVWQTIVETWRYIPVSHLRYDLGGIWTSPRTRSRDVLALLISGRSIDKTNKHGGMSNISGTISESQICSIKLGEMDLIFNSHIPEVKASVNWIICIKFWQWCAF